MKLLTSWTEWTVLLIIAATAATTSTAAADAGQGALKKVNEVDDSPHLQLAIAQTDVEESVDSMGKEVDEERDLRGRKESKGGKGDKGRKDRGKASNQKVDGINHCLDVYRKILSTGTFMYGKGGKCEDNFEVHLACRSGYSICSYAEKSLRPDSTFALDTCSPFDLHEELQYDADTGMCTIGANGAINLKRKQEDACDVPTAEYSIKVTFSSNDASTLYIDFSDDGGETFYTEEEGDEARVATPYSDFVQRKLQTGLCKGDGSFRQMLYVADDCTLPEYYVDMINC